MSHALRADRLLIRPHRDGPGPVPAGRTRQIQSKGIALWRANDSFWVMPLPTGPILTPVPEGTVEAVSQ